MPGEREPERQSSVITDRVCAAEQIRGVRASYIRLSTSSLLACVRYTGCDLKKGLPES
jgi:hypothetical protein